jgi:hypothetical protein
MEKNRLEKELRNHFSAEVEEAEPSHGWWNNAISQVVARKNNLRWFGLVPKTRLAWAFLPLVVLLFAGAVYGAISGVERLFETWAKDVETAGLSTALSVSQTVNGITVTLEKAYADSNVILIGYSIDKPNEKTIYGGKLTTSDGQVLNPVIGMGVVPDKELGFNDNATIWGYDASSLTGTPSDLNLKLEVSPITLADANVPTQEASELFTFNFTLPFHGGTSIDIGQTVEVACVPVTLEQVTISPWGVRAVVRNPDGDDFPIVSLILPNGDQVNGTLVRRMETSIVNYFMGDFTGQSGEWTMSIKELVLDSPDTPQQRLAGPWVFHFNVP